MRAPDLHTYKQYRLAGLDVKTSPLELANNPKVKDRLTMADNAVYPVTGGVSKRLDITTITSTSLGTSVTVSGGFQLRLSDGTDRVIVGTDDGRLVRVDTDGTTTNLATGLTAGTRWAFCQYNDLAICCNGGDAPRKSTGLAAATTTLAGSPPATAIVPAAHGNRVFMILANSSALYWSALNNEEDWTTAGDAGNFFVMENDGSNCVGLVPSINELVILKGRRAHRLQGASPTTFTLANLIPSAGSVGAVSRSANVFALNDVWWLSTAGVHNLATTQRFGDLREAFASDPIEPYFRPATTQRLSMNQLSLAVGAYDPQNNQLLFAVDQDNDGENELILVYDVSLQSWSVWPDFTANVASMWPVYNSTDGLTEIWCGGYDGHVRVLNRDVSTNAIDFHVKHISNLGAPGIEKSPRHLFVYAKEEGNINLTVTTNFDFGNAGGQSYTMSLLGNAHTLGVNWVLGVDPLGAQTQLVKRIDLSGIGEYLEVGFRNQNAGESATVYGYEVMWRPRRIVRRQN